MKFDEDAYTILAKKNNKKIAQINMATNKVVTLTMPVKASYAIKAEDIDQSMIWHLSYSL